MKQLDRMFGILPDDETYNMLVNYRGQKLTVEDGKGNIVEQSDTRELEKEKLRQKMKLKKATNEKMLSDFPLHKQLNFSDLPADEQAMYSAKKKDLLEKYEQRKKQLEACASLDELDKLNLSL